MIPGLATELPDLRFNEVRFKASHNSYDRLQPIYRHLVYRTDDRRNAGCRGLELDLHQSASLDRWSVNHTGGYKGDEARQLSTYLALLDDMVDDDDDPVLVTLDLKTVGDDGAGVDRLDDYIAAHVDDAARIHRPGAAGPWPKLDQMRGRFVLCLSGSKKKGIKDRYRARPDRLCFADHEFWKKKDVERAPENTRFFNIGWPNSPQDVARRRFALRAIREDFPHALIRGYWIETREQWESSAENHLNVISTDSVNRDPWAFVGEAAFVLR